MKNETPTASSKVAPIATSKERGEMRNKAHATSKGRGEMKDKPLPLSQKKEER